MEEYQNQRKIIELFAKLKKDETKQQTLLQLLNEGIIDLAPAMVIYAQHLTIYKENAQQDIQTLSKAGIDLAEKEIKKIASIKSLNKKQLKTAQAQTLISGNGYRGTKFGDELEKGIDMSIVDPEWYEQCWKLKTLEKDRNHE